MKKAYVSMMVIFCLLSVVSGPVLSNTTIFTTNSHGMEH